MSGTRRPYTIRRWDPELQGYPVVTVETERTPSGHRVLSRVVHRIGYVFREGVYGWTAQPAEDGRAPFGGYSTRAAAAEALWEDWRAGHLAVALRLTAGNR